MKAKTKLISTIVAMCLVITLGVFGILAVKTLNMSVGGNITFSADGLSLEVSQGVFKTDDDVEYTNITTQTGKLQAFAIDTNTKLSDIQDKIDSWVNLELALDSKGDAILHFSVTNKMSTPLFVHISTSLGENVNENMDIIASQSGVSVDAGQTKNFEIIFDIIDMNINAGLLGFAIDVDFDRGEKLLTPQNKIDQATGLPTTEVDYYYIEMGTYNGQPVRWRYVADGERVKCDNLTPPQSLHGYFVLETEVLIDKMFLDSNKYDASAKKHIADGYTNINANDYGISDIRAYLTNTGEGGFIDMLGIDVDNLIYRTIKARNVVDLYSEINYDGSSIDNTNSSYSLSLTGDNNISMENDKFWLMSYKEVEAFFTDDDMRVWGTFYWLRSPFAHDYDLSLYIGPAGFCGNHQVIKSYFVRPAFKI